MEPEGLAHSSGPLCPRTGVSRVISAFQDRGDEDVNLVDLTTVEEGAEHCTSPFDQQVRHPPTPQFG